MPCIHPHRFLSSGSSLFATTIPFLIPSSSPFHDFLPFSFLSFVHPFPNTRSPIQMQNEKRDCGKECKSAGAELQQRGEGGGGVGGREGEEGESRGGGKAKRSEGKRKQKQKWEGRVEKTIQGKLAGGCEGREEKRRRWGMDDSMTALMW